MIVRLMIMTIAVTLNRVTMMKMKMVIVIINSVYTVLWKLTI